MNNLSDQLNFNSNDHHNNRNKRKSGLDAYENDFGTYQMLKKRCIGMNSTVHKELNYAHQESLHTLDDVDMVEANQINGEVHLAYNNPINRYDDGNNNVNLVSCENPTLVQIKPHERHEVRSFCRPYWKDTLYQFGPFF